MCTRISLPGLPRSPPERRVSWERAIPSPCLLDSQPLPCRSAAEWHVCVCYRVALCLKMKENVSFQALVTQEASGLPTQSQPWPHRESAHTMWVSRGDKGRRPSLFLLLSGSLLKVASLGGPSQTFTMWMAPLSHCIVSFLLNIFSQL